MSLPRRLRGHIKKYNVFEFLCHSSMIGTSAFWLIAVLERVIGVAVSRQGTLMISTRDSKLV